MLVIEPIPGRDDDVALDPLGPGWLRVGQLSFGDTVRPVREVTETAAAEFFDNVAEHGMASLSGLNAAKPRFLGICELAQRKRHVLRKRAHGAHSYRMAVGAAVRLHQV